METLLLAAATCSSMELLLYKHCVRQVVAVRYVPASINLDDCIANVDGHLMFKRDRPAGFSATTRDICLSGTILQAQCQAEDGSYRPSSVDLNQYIGNIEGCLEWTFAGFADSSKDISLSDSSYLLTTFQTSQGTYYLPR